MVLITLLLQGAETKVLGARKSQWAQLARPRGAVVEKSATLSTGPAPLGSHGYPQPWPQLLRAGRQ